jgi:hypothetical protein
MAETTLPVKTPVGSSLFKEDILIKIKGVIYE